MSSKNRESEEMYLETILTESMKHPDLHAVDIANAMGFSKPSVSIAMKNLRELGYITIDSDSHIRLTEEGRSRASAVYERHRVFTRVLEYLGVTPQTAEEDACRIEHFISDETFQVVKNYAHTHGIL